MIKNEIDPTASMKKQRLNDVTIIRCILISFLVFFHAFCPYTGDWSPLIGQPAVPAYSFLGRLSYSFMLESFVFISGLVFGFQMTARPASLGG